MKLGQMPPAVLRGVIDDTHLADMELRNRERAKQLIEQMGRLWACHWSHSPRKERQ